MGEITNDALAEARMRERAQYALIHDHRGVRNEEAARLGEDVLDLLAALADLRAGSGDDFTRASEDPLGGMWESSAFPKE